MIVLKSRANMARYAVRWCHWVAADGVSPQHIGRKSLVQHAVLSLVSFLLLYGTIRHLIRQCAHAVQAWLVVQLQAGCSLGLSLNSRLVHIASGSLEVAFEISSLLPEGGPTKLVLQALRA